MSAGEWFGVLCIVTGAFILGCVAGYMWGER